MPERTTRGRMGRIAQLDPEIKAQLDRMLRSGLSQKEILRRLERPLAEAGETPLGYSTLNRYATRMEQHMSRVRERREIAEAWVSKLGEEPTGNDGQVLIEILRNLAFDVTMQAGADEDGNVVAVDPRSLSALALTIQRLERAADWNRKREEKLRAAVAAEAEQEAQRAGISDETAARIRAALEAA